MHLVGIIIRISVFCLHEAAVSISAAIALTKCDEMYVI